jgi:hypothetical protein
MVTERAQWLWRALRTRSRRLWHALVSIFFCAELTLIILLVTVPLYSERNRANVSRQVHVGKPYYKGQWAQSRYDGFGWHKIGYAIYFSSSIVFVCALHNMIRCDLLFHRIKGRQHVRHQRDRTIGCENPQDSENAVSASQLAEEKSREAVAQALGIYQRFAQYLASDTFFHNPLPQASVTVAASKAASEPADDQNA